MPLAPRRVQSVLDCLSRDPMMVLHPASITPEPIKRCCFRKFGQRMRRRCAKSIPLRCGSAGSAGRPDSVRDRERVTGVSQFLGLARSRGRRREAQQFADGIEIRANSRLVRAFVGMSLPIQEQGFYDLTAVGIANRLQRCSAPFDRNLLVNPVFDLFLDHFLDSASRLWITAKGLNKGSR
jgi:hypothetical protein